MKKPRSVSVRFLFFLFLLCFYYHGPLFAEIAGTSDASAVVESRLTGTKGGTGSGTTTAMTVMIVTGGTGTGGTEIGICMTETETETAWTGIEIGAMWLSGLIDFAVEITGILETEWQSG